MTPVSLLFVVLGIGLLFGGGEALVRGATSVAVRLGMSSLVVGLTVVAFATSAPELAASLTAALAGAPAVAVGNVLGSNLANIGLILGVAAMLRPIPVAASFIRGEIPLMIVVALLLFPMFDDRLVGRGDGAILLAVMVLYFGLLFYEKARTGGGGESVSLRERPLPTAHGVAYVAVGTIGLVIGAKLLVSGAVSIAESLGIPERVIGLTLVAVGTSLPELASCLAAARHGEGDIVLGNIVGSNVLNVVCILGATAAVTPMPLHDPGVLRDTWAVVAFSLALPLLLLKSSKVGRTEGGVLLAAYLLYVFALF
jgi:cation:H+ antiporter